MPDSLMDAHGPLTPSGPRHFNFFEDFNDIVWQSYGKPQRLFRSMKDLQQRIRYSDLLRSMGLVVDEAVMVFAMAPQDAMEARISSGVNQDGLVLSLDPGAFPRHPSLIVKSKPFDWPNRQGDSDPANRNAIGTTFRPLANDASEISSIWTDPESGHVYRKLLVQAQGGDDPEFTADWSKDGMIPTWARTA